MKREENQMDKMFRDAAQIYGVDPPASVWDKVSSGLDAHGRRVRMLWYRRLSVAASILLAFFIGYYFPGKQPEGNSDLSYNILPFSHVLPTAPEPLKVINDIPLVGIQTGTTTRQQPRGVLVTQDGANQISRTSGMSRVNGRTVQVLAAATAMTAPGLLALSQAFDYPVPQLAPDQTNDRGIRDNSWAIGAEASPMYAYRELERSTAENSFLAQSMAVDLDSEEKPVMGYTAGISASATLGKRWSLQSGVMYARQGQFTGNFRVSNKYPSSARAYTSAGMVVFDQTGNELLDSKTLYFDNQSIEGNDLIQQFDYLEVPLLARFKVIDGRMDISAMAGMSGGLLVGNRAYIQDESGQRSLVGYTYGARKTTLNTQVGLALDFPLSKKVVFSLSPGMRYSLTPVNTLSAIENRPYSFMLNSSLQLGF